MTHSKDHHEKIVISRRANNRSWHSDDTRTKISQASQRAAAVALTCECGAGPYRGPIGLKTHQRQKHGTPEQIARAGGRSHSVARGLKLPKKYQDIFKRYHGSEGPWSCYFCGEPVIKLLVHHKDHDRMNNAPENLVAAHRKCHNDHHGMGEHRIVTDAHRARISTALRDKTRQLSDEQRAALSERAHRVFSGRKQSPEQRARKSASMKASWAKRRAS